MQYMTVSKNSGELIVHELIFDVSEGKFVRPIKSVKELNKLIYNLKPGKYIKFAMLAYKPRNGVLFEIINVEINKNDEIKENVIYRDGFPFWKLWKIRKDSKAPEIFRIFIQMMPKFGKVSYVQDYKIEIEQEKLIDQMNEYIGSLKPKLPDL